MCVPPLLLNPLAVPLVSTATQLKLVPLTLFGFVIFIAVVRPLHNDCETGSALTSGIGFTVTLTLIGAPGQLLAVAVII